jgi:hypothetical protein
MPSASNGGFVVFVLRNPDAQKRALRICVSAIYGTTTSNNYFGLKHTLSPNEGVLEGIGRADAFFCPRMYHPVTQVASVTGHVPPQMPSIGAPDPGLRFLLGPTAGVVNNIRPRSLHRIAISVERVKPGQHVVTGEII